MKYLKIATSLTLLLFLSSCISIKKAPEVNGNGYTIVKGKKLKKSLGSANHFVFYNHLSDSDLTSYIEYKLAAEENSFLQNIPVKINDANFLMTFYTVESKDVTIDLLAPITNTALNKNLNTNFDENIQTLEREHYFVAVYVESDVESDSLKEESIHKAIVEKYLIKLMNDYQRIGSSQELDFITN